MVCLTYSCLVCDVWTAILNGFLLKDALNAYYGCIYIWD